MPDESANKIIINRGQDKAINYITNKSPCRLRTSVSRFARFLKAEVGGDVWPYIVAVHNDRVGFEIKGQISKQFYIVEDDGKIGR